MLPSLRAGTAEALGDAAAAALAVAGAAAVAAQGTRNAAPAAPATPLEPRGSGTRGAEPTSPPPPSPPQRRGRLRRHTSPTTAPTAAAAPAISCCRGVTSAGAPESLVLGALPPDPAQPEFPPAPMRRPPTAGARGPAYRALRHPCARSVHLICGTRGSNSATG
ncbi:hypothetical protein PLESTB_000750700 [Pleodorina starrii]|uniref:Uncharacterized protein n=1 Tax=Pleodorina starrii TaxID=330485 RepID=A0A9W6F2J7_9CHLO|nr:hypothetical protein PLESTM_002057400 [Pleodorina starrii]GLC53445.1 hypothetical protein PLESTB_000750700 [Pleodorina starrii]